MTVQAQQPTQQKVTYTTAQLQPGIKTQFLTTSIAQAQKPSAAQQVQTQIQVKKESILNVANTAVIKVKRYSFDSLGHVKMHKELNLI